MNFKKVVSILLLVPFAMVGCSVQVPLPDDSAPEPRQAQPLVAAQTRTVSTTTLNCNAAKMASARSPYMRPALLSVGATEFEVQRLNEKYAALSSAYCGPNPGSGPAVDAEIHRIFDTIAARMEQMFGFAPGDGRGVLRDQFGKFNAHVARNCGVTASMTVDVLMGTRPPVASLGTCNGFDPRGNPLSSSRETIQSCMANLKTALAEENMCQSAVGDEPEDDDTAAGPLIEEETDDGKTLEQETRSGDAKNRVKVELDADSNVVKAEGETVDSEGQTVIVVEATRITATVRNERAEQEWIEQGSELALEVLAVGLGAAVAVMAAPGVVAFLGGVAAGVQIVRTGKHVYDWWRSKPSNKFCIDGSRFNPGGVNRSIPVRTGSLATAFNDCLCRATEAMPSVSFKNCPMCDLWMGGGRCSTETQRALVRCLNTIPEGGPIRLECQPFRAQIAQKHADQRTCQTRLCGGDSVAVASVSRLGATSCACVERGQMQPDTITRDLCRTVSCGTGSSCTCTETSCGCSRTSDLDRPPRPPGGVQ
jgi:hypothetical protein